MTGVNTTTSSQRPGAVAALEIVSVLLLGADVLFTGVEFGIELLFDLLWFGLFIWLALGVSRRGSARRRFVLTALILAGLAASVFAVIYWKPTWSEFTEAFSELTALELAGGLLVWTLTLSLLVLLWLPSTSEWIDKHQASKTARQH